MVVINAEDLDPEELEREQNNLAGVPKKVKKLRTMPGHENYRKNHTNELGRKRALFACCAKPAAE